ncbi:uncharacterized protein V1516DRAFT_681979 [Lipomyces oligophaga]|uniref:uncharacterized protein n=1 Tax=Lipomyces oligophaga TaxID=45792 RepID=UPI0034CDCAA7
MASSALYSSYDMPALNSSRCIQVDKRAVEDDRKRSHHNRCSSSLSNSIYFRRHKQNKQSMAYSFVLLTSILLVLYVLVSPTTAVSGISRRIDRSLVSPASSSDSAGISLSESPAVLNSPGSSSLSSPSTPPSSSSSSSSSLFSPEEIDLFSHEMQAGIAGLTENLGRSPPFVVKSRRRRTSKSTVASSSPPDSKLSFEDPSADSNRPTLPNESNSINSNNKPRYQLELAIESPLFSPPDTRTQPGTVALVVGIITIVTASLMM